MAIEFKELIKKGEATFQLGVIDPSQDGVNADISTIGTSTDNKQWVKVGPNSTDWRLFLTSESDGSFSGKIKLSDVSDITPEVGIIGLNSEGKLTVGDGSTVGGSIVGLQGEIGPQGPEGPEGPGTESTPVITVASVAEMDAIIAAGEYAHVDCNQIGGYPEGYPEGGNSTILLPVEIGQLFKITDDNTIRRYEGCSNTIVISYLDQSINNTPDTLEDGHLYFSSVSDSTFTITAEHDGSSGGFCYTVNGGEIIFIPHNATTSKSIQPDYYGPNEFTVNIWPANSKESGVVGNIVYFICHGCGITKIDVSKCSKLKTLHCSGNYISELNVDSNPEIESIQCNYNYLKSLHFNHNYKLETIYCNDNFLTSLDVRDNHQLSSLTCSNNQLEALEVSIAAFNLSWLRFDHNNITSFDFTFCTGLRSLNCSNNKLTELDISYCPALIDVTCSYNDFIHLDFSSFGNNMDVDFSNHQSAPRIYSTNCPHLLSVDLSNVDNMQEMSFSHCSSLSTLIAHNFTGARSYASSYLTYSANLKHCNFTTDDVYSFIDQSVDKPEPYNEGSPIRYELDGNPCDNYNTLSEGVLHTAQETIDLAASKGYTLIL